MADRHRLTIRSIDPDPRAASVLDGIEHLGLDPVGQIIVADIVFVDGDLESDAQHRLHAVLVDPLLQFGSWATPTTCAVEVTPLPGVTDAGAHAVEHAANVLGIDIRAAATGVRVEFPDEPSAEAISAVIERLVANDVIERWSHDTVDPFAHLPPEGPTAKADIVLLRSLSDDQLADLNTERGMSLDPEELAAIRSHFQGLDRDPTDVELETLAQTWSEHCAHKTFRARINIVAGPADDLGTQRPPLLGQLRQSTESLAAPFVVSSFVGNAGVVEFEQGTTLALKAETHNHPSAVEPFGGANTGVGGVIRDVLGIAHRPIAVTDILCFGPPELPLDELPTGTLHPRRIRAGVIDGIADYGNKIGLPTVAGAVLYDDRYTANPLVFAGCIGSAPTRGLHAGPYPGDRVVVLGGATGRDGIRGATFSSATMDATTGDVAGASVQIGDPITEKLLIDALVGAEDLYSAITDCGAGGLSSAIGEMAEGVGADVELDAVPRKYPGLAPWEVWLSEAQERMVVAVPADDLDELRARCEHVGVTVADVGEFTGDNVLIVRSGGTIVAEINTEFLHDGRPQREMDAALPEPDRSRATRRKVDDPVDALRRLLQHPNIASKASTIHRYDHEIGGSTVVRPLVGAAADAPADGVVLAPIDATAGVAIGIGVNPWYGLHDPESMALAVVDEAIRNVVAVGADPDKVALLDNFSWGDPRRASTLGELVAAVDGCCTAAHMYRAPFVSGKDSLNNEYLGSDGERHSVPPTLVITAVAHLPDADHCVTPDLVAAGNVLMMLGSTEPEFAGSHLDLVLGEPAEPGVAPAPDPDAPAMYRKLHAAMRAGLVASCHDVSEGGAAVALAEMCIGGRLGANLDQLPGEDAATALFAESIGRLIVEIEPRRVAAFLRVMDDDATRIGVVTDRLDLRLPAVTPIPVSDLVDWFQHGPDDPTQAGGPT